jgi:hypothetical protein
VVLTGGPGAGKTAVLEIVQRHFCEHVIVLPEAASILFGGGFPRLELQGARRAAQRAIYHVQRELEAVALANDRAAVILCDRGTLDGIAYWPGTPDSFYAGVATSREAELARYAAVIHLRTPTKVDGYDHSNRLRVETDLEAHLIDERIELAWAGHPRRVTVPSSHDFMEKVARAIECIESEIPACCRTAARADQTVKGVVPASLEGVVAEP